MPEWIMPWFVFEMLGEHFGLVCREGRGQPKQFWKQGANRTDRRTRRLCCDRLEERTLMSVTPGYDYVLSGESWPNPSHITYSIAPDGVWWDHGINNLNATFNAKFGTSGIWERQIALALATWESVANINIVPVSDGPYDLNTLGLAQGDPRFGDIRFGGYPFLDTTITLAQTYFPPPNGSTAAGDVELNTSMNFNIGSTYDLYSVVLHETGHSLGLNEAPNPAEVMATDYGGLRTGLEPGDIAGIQAIYGARTLDSYQSQGIGVGLGDPIDLSKNLAASNQAVISGVSLSSIGSTEYYSFVAPSYASGALQVTAAASNISMLSPQVSIYNASGTLLAQASNPSAWSDNVTASVPAVVPGQRYYMAVTGDTQTYFDVGAFQLVVSLPQSSPPTSPAPTPPPVVPTPTSIPTPTPQPPPIVSQPPPATNTSPQTAFRLGRVTQTTLPSLSFNSGLTVEYFDFRSGEAGAYQINATGASIQVLNARGRLIAQGTNQVNVSNGRAGTAFYLKLRPATSPPVTSYSLSISLRSLLATVRKTTRRR
jgi:Matrixin